MSREHRQPPHVDMTTCLVTQLGAAILSSRRAACASTAIIAGNMSITSRLSVARDVSTPRHENRCALAHTDTGHMSFTRGIYAYGIRIITNKRARRIFAFCACTHGSRCYYKALKYTHTHTAICNVMQSAHSRAHSASQPQHLYNNRLAGVGGVGGAGRSPCPGYHLSV